MSSFRRHDRVRFAGNGAQDVWHKAYVGDYGMIVGVMPNDPDVVIVALKNNVTDRQIVHVNNLAHWARFKAGDRVAVTQRSRAHQAAVGDVGLVVDILGPAMYAVRFPDREEVQYLVDSELTLKEERA